MGGVQWLVGWLAGSDGSSGGLVSDGALYTTDLNLNITIKAS